MKYLLTLLLFLFIQPVQAAGLDLEKFRVIPVADGGRIKPLDSFARSLLKEFSGADHLANLSAASWLAESLFDPGHAVERPVFYLGTPALRHRLGVSDRQPPLYAYNELTAGLGQTIADAATLGNRDKKDLSQEDRALLDLHEHALLYTQILRSFSLILPLDVAVPEKIPSALSLPTYLDLQKSARLLTRESAAIVARKGENFDAYTAEERKTVLLSYQLSLLTKNASRNQLLRIIPAAWSRGGSDWLSPWTVLNQGQGSPDTARLLKVWQRLALAWQAQDAQAWQQASVQAAQVPLTLSGRTGWQLNLEVSYNQLAPFDLSAACYAFALLLILAFFIGGKKLFSRGAACALGLGAALHAGGIGMRIAVLGRPPVSTLYESLIFVALVCVLIGLALEPRFKSGAGLLLASVTGLLLLLLAASFADGDTLLMLTAVLNTQFWLATHVLCITFGYGWCIAAAVMAHLLLLARAFRLLPEARIEAQTVMLTTVALVALLFTATGTILGGIWADQSWGRFWGWDPKENGALLIVLWLVWLLHGKLSGHLSQIPLLAGYAALGLIVGASWIGVNLLGVGLHSYGFTDGVFYGLAAFTITDLGIIGALWLKCGNRHAA